MTGRAERHNKSMHQMAAAARRPQVMLSVGPMEGVRVILMMARAAMVLLGILLGVRGTVCHARETYSIQDRGRWRPVSFETLASTLPESREFAGSDRPYVALISTLAQWEALWRSAFANVVDGRGIALAPPVPELSFTTKSLLVITMGAGYPFQGQAVRIEGVWESREVLLVQVVETTNACFTLGDTHPRTAALIPHSEKQVVVDVRNEIMVCE